MSLNEFYQILKYLSIATTLLPFAIGIYLLKKLKNEMWFLLLYLGISVLSDGISILLANQGISNFTIRNTYTLIEFCTFAYIYFRKFNDVAIKSIIKVAGAFYVIASMVILFGLNKFNSQENYLSAAEACFFMLLGYTYLYHLFRDYDISKLEDDVFFWVNNAILIYFSANFVLFLFFGNVVTFKKELFYFVYSFHLILNITYNLILSFGIWKAKNS